MLAGQPASIKNLIPAEVKVKSFNDIVVKTYQPFQKMEFGQDQGGYEFQAVPPVTGF